MDLDKGGNLNVSELARALKAVADEASHDKGQQELQELQEKERELVAAARQAQAKWRYICESDVGEARRQTHANTRHTTHDTHAPPMHP